MAPGPFLLGDWRVEPSLNQLERASSSFHVTPKAMEVLVLLASRPGDALTREELLDGVWSDVTVNEEVLTRAVADLRKVLDDDPRAPRFIATIPKRGYRLVAPVTFVDRETPVPPRRLPLGLGLAGVVVMALFAWAFRDVGDGSPRALETVPLTSLPGREILPALSPDGTRVAFVWQGEQGDNWDVYVERVGTDDQVRLTTNPAPDASPVWSPDGSRVAFERYREGEPCRIFEVSALDPDEGAEREIGSCGASQNPDLVGSPDGRLLAFSDRDVPSESFGIFLLDRATGERRKLVAPDGQHWGDKDPAFSPDGDWVSFTRSMSMNTQDVFRIRVESGAPERVTFDGREIRRSAFTPDGRALVVSSARNGRLALWRVPLDGGTPQWLLFSGGEPRSPSVAASGSLVFEERRSDSDLHYVRVDDAEGVGASILSSTREEREPALSPDGERLAFVSTRSGFPELWVAGLSSADDEAEKPMRLTDFRGPYVGSPRWAPDGSRIVFDARPDGNADVFWVDAAGSTPRRVTEEPSNELAPSYSPDGRLIYFGSDRSGVWQIWRVAADGSRPAECVTETGGYLARPSLDGRELYFTKYDRRGLFRLELASGEETHVPGTEGLSDPSLLDVGSDALVFVELEGTRALLLELDGTTRTPSEIATLEALQPGGGLSFDWHRRRAFFTRVVGTESDLVRTRLP